MVVCFNLDEAQASVAAEADRQGVAIHNYSVIYKAIDQVLNHAAVTWLPIILLLLRVHKECPKTRTTT